MNHDLETLFINEGKLQRFNQNRETFEPYMSIEELKVLTKRPSNGPRIIGQLSSLKQHLEDLQ